MYKNLVIISIDSLRADATSFSHQAIHDRAEPRLRTPNLDKLARQGSYIEKAYSTNTYTTAAHASLFTGRYPYDHQVRAFFDFNQKLNPQLSTLADTLLHQNFQTFFYSDVPELFSENDIWRGFRVKTMHNSNLLFDSLADLKKERNFIFFHLFDVHEPYLYPEDKSQPKKAYDDYYDAISTLRRQVNMRSDLNQKKNPYDSWEELRRYFRRNSLNEKQYLYPFYLTGVNNFDRERLPKLLDSLDKLGYSTDNTLFVFLSDHGEGRTAFEKENLFAHAGEITEDVLRIYLTLSHSGINKQFLSITHLKNICLSLLGLPNPSAVVDTLSRLILPPGHIYAESHYNYVGDKLPQGVSDQGSLMTLAKKRHIQPEYVLGSRAFINRSSKYVLHGEPEYLTAPESAQATKAEVIDRIYKSILCRFPDASSKQSILKSHRHKLLDRDSLAYEILISPEKSHKPYTEAFETIDLVDQPIVDTAWTIQAKFHWLSALTTHMFHPRRHYRFSKLINNY